MKVLLTKEERKKLLHAAFCGAGHFHYGAMGIEYSQDDYKIARDAVDPGPCREDVWLKMFELDMPIWIEDFEDDEKYFITPERLANLDNLPINIIYKILDGDYDAEDLDWVLEFIMFNEKIYG